MELDSFERDLFIFDPYLLLAKISLKFCKYVRLTVCLFVCLFVCLSVIVTIQVAPLEQSTPNFTGICILDLARSV